MSWGENIEAEHEANMAIFELFKEPEIRFDLIRSDGKGGKRKLVWKSTPFEADKSYQMPFRNLEAFRHMASAAYSLCNCGEKVVDIGT